jgi:hypothetical protein
LRVVRDTKCVVGRDIFDKNTVENTFIALCSRRPSIEPDGDDPRCLADVGTVRGCAGFNINAKGRNRLETQFQSAD